MRKLILFDIDGTLVWTDGAGRSAIREALLRETGSAGHVEGFQFGGKTDRQIVRELMIAAGDPEAENRTRITAVCERYLEFLVIELEKRRLTIHVFPGVWDLLTRLEQRPDARLGLITGNLAEGARLKLATAGIDPDRFRIGAFGSDATDRADLPAVAVDRAAAAFGWTAMGDEIVIVGDTPADMTCGRAVDARAIGVATGRHTTEELLVAGAFRAFESLASWEAVIEAVYA